MIFRSAASSVTEQTLYSDSIRDICEEAGWLFEIDDDGCVLVVVPFLYPESEYDEDDAEAEGNQNSLCTCP